MPEPRRQIFREQSLEKLSSPDRLDEMMRVIKPQGWIILLAIAIGIALAITWSIVGRIPATANGSAVLIYPKKVVAFQSPGSGQLFSIDVAVGDTVEEGQILATIRVPELERELDDEREKREYITGRNATIRQAEREFADGEKGLLQERAGLISERMDAISDRIQTIRRDADVFRGEELKYVDLQEASVKTAVEELGVLDEQLEGLLEAFEELRNANMVTKEAVLDARLRKASNELQIRALENEGQALDLARLGAEKTHEDRMVRIDDLDFRIKDLIFQLQDIKIRTAQIDREYQRALMGMETEEGEIERRIKKLEAFLEKESRVRAQYAGEIQEITAVAGQQVAIGTRLGKLEKADKSALMALAYFTVKDGKKIKLGQTIRVSPATVQRERYGGIVGLVTRISDYTVSTEAASSQIGSLEMARSVLGGQNRIEVEVELQPDPETFTKFEWTSGKGPDNVEITAGTTAVVRVTIEERKPYTLILPFLKTITGN